MSSRRLALVVLPFLLLNAYWVYRSTTSSTDEPEGPRILAFRTGPWDAVGSVADEPGPVRRLVFRFDRPMVHEMRLGQTSPEGEMTLSPPVDGRLVWDDPATLLFEADRPLPAGTVFLARLDRGLADMKGQTVVGERTRRFVTGALRVRNVRFRRFTGDGHPQIELHFSLPVRPAELAQHVVVSGPDGEWSPVPVTVAPERIQVIRLPEPIVGELTVRIRSDLRAEGGDWPLGKDSVHRVEAREALRPWFRDPVRETAARVALPISFNRSVEREELLAHLGVEPATEITVEGRGARWRVVGDFRRGARYVLTVREGLRGGPAELESEVRQVFHPPDRKPTLRLATKGGRYLGADGACAVELNSVNVPEARVTIDRIDPRHVAHRVSGVARHDELTTRLLTRRVPLGGGLDEDRVTRLDLRELLGEEARGILRLRVREPRRWIADHADVVVSDLGLSLDLGERRATVRVASIATAEPVAGVAIRLLDAEGLPIAAGETGADGTAILPRSRWESGRKPAVLVGTRGLDATYLALSDARLDRSELPVRGLPWLSDLAASVHSDRGIYRPGETLRVKAFVRAPGIEVPPDMPVALRLIRPDGRARSTVVTRTGDDGHAHWEVPLPDWAPTGRWTVEVRIPDDRLLGRRAIRVEEYLPDRIRVEATMPEGRLTGGAQIDLTVSARLLAGPPAAGSPVTGALEGRPVPFRPEGWSAWTFGDDEDGAARFRRPIPGTRIDPEGRAAVSLALPRPTASRPYRLTARVSVLDPGGRAVTARVERVLDTHGVYLGLREAKADASVDRRVEIVALNADGTPADLGEVRLELQTVTWSSWWERRQDGSWRWHRGKDLARLGVRTVELWEGRGRVDVRLPDGRDVRVGVSADGVGGAGLVLGSGGARPVEHPTRIELTADRTGYRPGDEVVVEMTSPHGGRLHWQLQDADVLLEGRATVESTGEIRFRIPDVDAPSLHLVATVLRSHGPGRAGVPRAYGVLPIELRHDRVDLAVDVVEEVRAGSELTVRIEANAAEGPIADADLCVMLVDEGILRLTGHRAVDPGETFLGRRRCGTWRYDVYGRLLPALRNATDAEDGGGAEGGTASHLNPVRAKRVDPLVDWRPSVRTDENGRAEVTFRLPDRTGEVRVMVLAARGRRFGVAEEHVRLTRPLDVHAHLPRVLAPGDEVVVPLEVTNATGAPGVVRLALTTEGPLEVLGAPAPLSLAADARGVVEATLRATHAGPATVVVEAFLGAETARESTEIPVRPAAPRTRVGGAVMLRPGQEVVVGSDAAYLTGTRDGGLVLSRSPTVRLRGAMGYLLDYPWGCIEQTTSRAMPLVHLRALAASARLEMDEAWIDHRVQAGVDRILSMLTPSGGLAVWPGGRSPDPWGTCYGTHFLLAAKRAGHDVPDGDLERLLDWLGRAAREPRWRTSVAAYALYVRSLAGRRDLHALTRVAVRSADLPDWQREMLLAVAARLGGLEDLPPPDAVRTGAVDRMHSETRALAIRLLSLHDRDPQNAGIPDLVQALLARQTDGRWGTTQENAFALLALGRICEVVGGKGRVRVGDEDVPLDGDEVVHCADSGGPVRLRWSGPGVAWCSWHVEGVRSDEPPPEEDRVLAVRRRLLDLEGEEPKPGDLRRGDLVVVELTLSATAPTSDLVLVDPLPGCIEIENPAIRTRVAGVGPAGDLAVERYEVRDDRLILFARLTDTQPRTWRYLVRVTAAGRFAVPPVWLEAMYAPERRSLHGAGTMEVTR